MKPDRSPFQIYRIAFAVILLVHLIFLFSAIFNPPAPLSDSGDYLNASENLYSSGTLYCGDLSLPIQPEQFTRRPPLYPVLLGVASLFGSEIPFFLFQILISLTSIFLVFRIFFPNSNSFSVRPIHVGITTLLLLATPAQFIYANRIMAELLFQLLLVLMTWSVYRYFKYKDSKYIWLFNLFLTLGMATKPVLFPFTFFILLISPILFVRTRNRTFLWALCLPILWISFYSVRNNYQTDSSQYSSIQTANMVNYNMRYFLMEQEGSDAAAAEVDRLYAACDQSMGYMEKNRCLNQGVKEKILERPLKYGVFHLKGCLRYFIDPGRFDLVTFFNWEHPDSGGFLQKLNQEGLKGAFGFLKQQGLGMMVLLALIALFKLFKVSGFILYLVRDKELLPFKIFLALLVGYLAFVTGPLGASRFLLPVELLLIGAAVQGWCSLKLKDFKYFRKVG
jgi:4-amino-4-deoxy-L-arabinose transferase-like glycosyltransferase